VAGAVVHEPELQSRDAPARAVDTASRRDWCDKLGERAAAGATLLVSTRYMDEAERSRTLAILDRGRLVADGSPDALTGGLRGRTFEVASAQPRRAQEALREQDGVLSVAQIGNSVRVLAEEGIDGDEALRRFRAALPGTGDRVEPVTPNLEDVFVAATHGALAEVGP